MKSFLQVLSLLLFGASTVLAADITINTQDTSFRNANTTLSDNISVTSGGNLVLDTPTTTLNAPGGKSLTAQAGTIYLANDATMNIASGAFIKLSEGAAFKTIDGAMLNLTGPASGAALTLNLTGTTPAQTSLLISNATLNASFSSTTANGIQVSGNSSLTVDRGATVNIINAGGNALYTNSTSTSSAATLLSGATLTATQSSYSNIIYTNGTSSFTANNGSILSINLTAGTGIYTNGTSSFTANEGSTLSINLTAGNGIRTNGTAASFTLSNASLTTNSSGAASNGIYTDNGSSFTANNGASLDITSASDNGIYTNGTSSFILSNATLTANHSTTAAGIYTNNGSSFTANNGSTINITASKGFGIHSNNTSTSFTLSGASLIANVTNTSAIGIFTTNGASFTANNGASIDITGGSGINTNGTSSLRSSFTLSNASLTINHTLSSGGFPITSNNSSFTANQGAIINITTNIDSMAVSNVNGTFTIADGTRFTANIIKASTTLQSSGANSLFFISNSTIDITNANGGGISNLGNSNFTINQSSRVDATVYGTGTALSNSDTLSNMTITGGSTVNATANRYAVYNTGTLNISNATVNAVTTSSTGVGVYNSGSGTINIADNAILNIASSNASFIGFRNIGGAIAANFTTVNITNGSLVSVTDAVFHNSKGTATAGIVNIDATSTFRLGANATLKNDGNFTSLSVIQFSGTNQTIAGNGTLNANLSNINHTVHISPNGAGNTQTGTLTIVGNQDLRDGFIYDWQLGASSADLVLFDGNLTLDAAPITLNLSTTGTPSIDASQVWTWELFRATGIIGTDIGLWYFNGTDTSFLSALGLTGTLDVALSDDQKAILLQFTPIPEPSTYALLAGLAILALAITRRRK